ncbi:tyrosyl-DNA phosphodiesterase-domain-containing protein [Syncephalastrum racemosum]|uniref:Tyrosyl-DNA phosphodiesterase-domain-containing protein n=1 Tax=Syncephalastrum racemosum TaxID=13706 RepID=A0A1X2HTY4_SYNRA|nr:tyrosyl-DNA phosphodiesterase-domain-containing protein [Syncephalastrum racemosum]
MDEDEDLKQAIALSLRDRLEGNDSDQHEQHEMKQALALSLGKTVEQLTARDMMRLQDSMGSNQGEKRPFSESTSPTSDAKRTAPERFWDGVVRLTYVEGFTLASAIRFEDIVQKSHLRKALITAMVVSTDWIEEQFPPDINLCVVLHGRPAMARKLDNRVFIMPPMKDENWGVFHSKLMLLFHTSSVRVVIGSANLEPYDYRDLENVVFIQDFPESSHTVAHEKDLPEFARDLCDLLDKMQVPPSVKQELFKYDFSRAKAHIVASVSGVFHGDYAYRRYGHPRLADVVRQIDAANPETRIEIQTSSLGGMTPSYLHELYRSCCGTDPYANGGKTPRVTRDMHLPPVDIIYPSRDTVEDSKLGPPGAGTICFNRASWEKTTFPKQIMCDSISHRAGTLMHSKYIIASLPGASKKGNNAMKGWVYVGSHNATMGAWGKLSQDKMTKEPKTSINNWELGIVLPLHDTSDIPAPYLRPPPRYKPGQQPWTQEGYFD